MSIQDVVGLLVISAPCITALKSQNESKCVHILVELFA